ncbi:hypothetical protein GF589_14260, partial [Staphylococcus aureus]|nr:hypothetical protein [Staphylococcus aureus]
MEPEPIDTLQTVTTPEKTLKPAPEQALPAVSEDVTVIENPEIQSQSGVTGISDNNEGWGVSTPPAQAAVDEHRVVESVKPVVPVVFSYPPDFPSFIKVGEKVKFQSLVTTGWRKGTIVKI